MEEVVFMDAIINPEVIPHNVSYGILASVILIIVALSVRSSLRLVPKGLQNFIEMIVTGGHSESMGDHNDVSMGVILPSVRNNSIC